ncbi:MAG TPA: hypothetical protein VEC12_06735, partial [Bacteroidia bacterium]|nr:hypothetical protein [Bacteroidia bacterium]
MKPAVFLCLFLAFSATAAAQNCQWLEVVGAPTSGEILNGITIDNNNDVIVGGAYSDSFTLDTFHLPFTNSSSFPLLVKYSETGTVKWVLTTLSSSTPSTYFIIQKLATDINNNIYAYGIFSGSIDFGNGVSHSTASGGCSLLLKLDKDGRAQWTREISGNGSGGGDKVIVDDAGNVYLAFSYTGTLGFTGTAQTITSSGYDLGIVKYSSSGNFLGAASFGGNGFEIFSDAASDAANNVYMTGISDATFNFGAQTLTDSGRVILKLDSSLAPLKAIKTNLHGGHYGSIGMGKNGRFSVISTFYDSVNFGNNIWLKSPWTYTGGFSKVPNCIVYYDSSLTPIWARKSDTVSANSVLAPYGGAFMKADNIYFGGFIEQGSARFGGSVLNYVGGGSYKFYLVKMDTVGNFLWAFTGDDSTGNSILHGINVDNVGDVVITGIYIYRVKVFNHAKNSAGTGNDFDAFTAKITDYTITRGTVSSGPYCAGDTIKIPYTKRGVFKIGNQFIAQLSDSSGGFEGGERELGRVIDTASGVINGLLPLFNVPSTSKYRIRIISTNPVVQSFYKLDTLRLLVYSKDTANAGPDTLICRGQSIRLGTTGGSRWQWSPLTYMQNLADTANRQPLVKPDTLTEYRVI